MNITPTYTARALKLIHKEKHPVKLAIVDGWFEIASPKYKTKSLKVAKAPEGQRWEWDKWEYWLMEDAEHGWHIKIILKNVDISVIKTIDEMEHLGIIEMT